MKRTGIIRPLMRSLIISLTIVTLLTFMISTGLADADEALPWGMTWDTSVEDYVALLQAHTALTNYSITEYTGGGRYSVMQTDEKGDQSIEYGAEFVGDITSKKITEHTLSDVANQHLRLTWMSIGYWPAVRIQNSQRLVNGEAFAEFIQLYQQFQEQYGKYTVAYSFIQITNQGMDERYRLPQKDGSVDFDSINQYVQRNASTIDTFWLTLGNGNAICRFYFTKISNDGEDPDGF